MNTNTLALNPKPAGPMARVVAEFHKAVNTAGLSVKDRMAAFWKWSNGNKAKPTASASAPTALATRTATPAAPSSSPLPTPAPAPAAGPSPSAGPPTPPKPAPVQTRAAASTSFLGADVVNAVVTQALTKAYAIHIGGQQVFSSASPSFTLAALEYFKMAARRSPEHRFAPPRLAGMAEGELVKTAAAAAADRVAGLATPHHVLDKLNAPGNFDGSGLEFRVVAGSGDQWKFEAGTWWDVVAVTHECVAAGLPCQVWAAFRGMSEVSLFKVGENVSERWNTKRKLEEAQAEAARAAEAKRIADQQAAQASARERALSSRHDANLGFSPAVVRALSHS